MRARRQIREMRISLALPAGAELAERLDSALEVIYLVFNKGYAAHSGEELIRRDLCAEALRLGRLVAGSPVGAPRAHALVALMAFQAARLPARVDEAGASHSAPPAASFPNITCKRRLRPRTPALRTRTPPIGAQSWLSMISSWR